LQLSKPPTYTSQLTKLSHLSQEEGRRREAASSSVQASARAQAAPSEQDERRTEPEHDLLADVISELEDNLEHARTRRIGDAYVRPSADAWRRNRNRLKLPDHVRHRVLNVYRQIDSWASAAKSGVKPNMGSPAIDATTDSLKMELPGVIEELRKLL
jgi:hypothetical protein